MAVQITAIETHYKGHRFRSRLEARWAVFMDALGVPWQYEVEGFKLPRLDDEGEPLRGRKLQYLPDFWLPEQDHWLEIKPAKYEEGGWVKWPEEAIEDKLRALSVVTGKRVVAICGTPGLSCQGQEYEPYGGFEYEDGGPDCFYLWCECPGCEAVGIQFSGRAERNKHKPGCAITEADRIHRADAPRLLRAYEEATKARFEFAR